MRRTSFHRAVWSFIALLASTSLAVPAWSKTSNSTPDGSPGVKHNVALPKIKNAKKNPNPVPTSKTVTLSNIGDATLTGLIGMPGAGQPFLCTAGCVPFSLAPGHSTTFTLAFAPASKGNYKDSLTITSNSNKKPSQPVKMHSSAKQGVPGGPGGVLGGGGPLPPPLTGCSVPVLVAQSGSGGSPSPGALTVETLLDSLTSSSNGVLPSLSQFANSTAAGLSLAQLPVVGAITSTPGGTLSGLPLSGPTAPTLGSLSPDPSTIPVLGTLVSTAGGSACQEFNSVVALTGPCGQALGVLLIDGTSNLGLADIASIDNALAQFAAQLNSAGGLTGVLSNPAQISGLLTKAQSDLSSIGAGLQPELTGAASQCAPALPSSCSQTDSSLGNLESLAPTTPGDVAPTLSQLTGSLPSGGSLSTLPVVGAVVTGNPAQFLPASLPVPSLGALTGGAVTTPSIPVLGSIPLNSGASQVDALVAVVDSASGQAIGVVPVLGAPGSVPSPSSIISQLQGGSVCSGFGDAINQIAQTLTSSAVGAPLPKQISGVPNLSSTLSTATTGLVSSIPGLGGLL